MKRFYRSAAVVSMIAILLCLFCGCGQNNNLKDSEVYSWEYESDYQKDPCYYFTFTEPIGNLLIDDIASNGPVLGYKIIYENCYCYSDCYYEWESGYISFYQADSPYVEIYGVETKEENVTIIKGEELELLTDTTYLAIWSEHDIHIGKISIIAIRTKLPKTTSKSATFQCITPPQPHISCFNEES